METPNPKCSGCLCYWVPDETDIKSSGLYYKTCKICRKKNKDRVIIAHQEDKCVYCNIDLKENKYKTCLDCRSFLQKK